MQYDWYQLLWLFLIYSLLGWVVEVAYVTLKTGHLVNRGFLNGPVCPIYGFGMLGVLLLLTPVQEQLLLLFLGGMALCTAVELFGGWVLDRMFHMRWWDYTGEPFNFHGYVCLGYSVMWGIGVVLVVRLLHPLIFGLFSMLPRKAGIWLLVPLYLAFAIDLAVTLKTVIGFSKSLGELDRIAGRLHQLGDEMSALVGNAVLDTSEKVEEERQLLEERGERFKENYKESVERGRNEIAERRADLQKRIEELEQKRMELRKRLSSHRRILTAFPNLHRSKSAQRLQDEIRKWKQSL